MNCASGILFDLERKLRISANPLHLWRSLLINFSEINAKRSRRVSICIPLTMFKFPTITKKKNIRLRIALHKQTNDRVVLE